MISKLLNDVVTTPFNSTYYVGYPAAGEDLSSLIGQILVAVGILALIIGILACVLKASTTNRSGYRDLDIEMEENLREQRQNSSINLQTGQEHPFSEQPERQPVVPIEMEISRYEFVRFLFSMF